MLDIKCVELIAADASVTTKQATAVIDLINSGGTIPFIARYRKDQTGNLDEVKIESIAEGNVYYTALTQRRAAITENIDKQGRLTDALKEAIHSCTKKSELEDLYLPFKKKRRTKATVARDQGLEALAEYLWRQEADAKSIEEHAQEFVDPAKSVESAEQSLEGARHILAERYSVDAPSRAEIREKMRAHGKVTSCTTKLSEGKKTKFEPYYAFSEAVKKIPSHRLLAILRGMKEGMLRMELALDDDDAKSGLIERFIKDKEGPFAEQIAKAIEDGYKRLIKPAIETEVLDEARQRANEEAIHVFRENAQNLLMAAPAGRLHVIGVDPGLRSGCKLAVVDDTGAYQENAVLFPEKAEEAEAILVAFLDKYKIQAIAIGNGTGSREASRFVSAVLAKREGSDVFWVAVNEAGASVYSASKLAREEHPDLDITVRGAISIARRLQDPLAELVKVEPKSIGVGQYQHDVNQKLLREGLHRSVESCVNRVGVDLNTASVPLLRYISGIQYGTAQNIVASRTEAKGFKNRTQLLEVAGIGPKVYEQCAGFLRIADGDVFLDSTAIHPESYPIVEKIAESLSVTPAELVGNRDMLDKVDLSVFESDTVGKIALHDVKTELLKPGRDPRKEFRMPKFIEGVNDVKDIEKGMEVEGVVTNVTNFGAFVDIGVHQDGLVHLSQLANRFVKDPGEVVKVGQIVKAQVIEVDKEAPRISLSMKALLPAPARKPRRPSSQNQEQDRSPSEGDRPRPKRAAPKRDAGSDRRPSRENASKRRDKPRKPNGKPRRDSQRSGKPKDHVSGDTSKMNTQLADQLASLRDKLNTDTK